MGIGMLSDKENFKNTNSNIYTNFHAVYRSVCTTSKHGMKEDIDEAFAYKEEKSHLLRRIPLYVVK